LSSLVERHLPRLHTRLAALEADPNHWAAPWVMTFFASTFPADFAARVIDFTFLDGFDALLGVSLSLLVEAEEELVACSSLEHFMLVLNCWLPALPADKLEGVVRRAISGPW
jgi:hypothetical protein